MIATVFGTTGELIKLFPVLRALEDRGRPALLITTGQQASQIPGFLDDFGLPQPTSWSGRGRRGTDLERVRDLPRWSGGVARNFARNRRRIMGALAADGRRPLVLVHGDTMTTVLGAAMGRAMGAPVAHLEAGLRSGSWRNPFPEELDRRAASVLASIHYAPGAWAAGNLEAAGVSGEIVDTGANTIRDSLALIRPPSVAGELPERYGLVSLHRQELLGRANQLRAILELLERVSRGIPLLFIDHPITAAAVADGGMDGVFGPRFHRVPRMRYSEFMGVLRSAEFLVTDSGGSQEECAAMGIPCLVHRATTERLDGLSDGSVVLSKMELSAVERFVEDPRRHRRAPDEHAGSPTQRILEHLESGGYV